MQTMLKNGEIDAKTRSHLLMAKPQFGKFYLLPKIHKRTHEVPGRPVISNMGTATENISGFLEYHLKEIVPNIPHILEDTRDFLERIEKLRQVPENAILVTFDVVGLYPSIPHADGIEAMKYYLEKFKTSKVSTGSLCELANLILKNNIFEFNDKFYQQCHGTAIGTKFAPPYANLFLAYLEEHTILKDAPLQPDLWWRYLDDVFCIWTHGEEALKTFEQFLNGVHPTINFTSKIMKNNSVDFLDVQLTKQGNMLSTDLYTKPVDTHQYLHSSSCHPFNCKKSIAYGQALRLKRICSDEEILKDRLDDLKTWMLKRGYKKILSVSKLKGRKIFPEINCYRRGKKM